MTTSTTQPAVPQTARPSARRSAEAVAKTARRTAGTLWRQREYAKVLTGPKPVAYVGWAGEANMGDDALLDGHRKLLPQQRLLPMPNLALTPTLRAVSAIRQKHPFDAIFLGGGTLIGNGHFRRTLETLLSVQPGADVHMLGPGVESHKFLLGNRTDVQRELEAWKPLLGRFSNVGVRGPLSAETLAHIGIEGAVIGDSALILGDAVPDVDRSASGIVGINVGYTDDLWGMDNDAVIVAASELAVEALAKGWTVHLLPVSTGDRDACERVVQATGGKAKLAPNTIDVDGFIAAARRCDVMVAEKLHAAVMAAAVFVPTITLEYRPKCLDFQTSIGRPGFNQRTDAIDVAVLLDMIEDSTTNRGAHVTAMASEISDLRGRLAAWAGDLTSQLAAVVPEEEAS